MSRQFYIPESAYEFRFVKASGPGGQHVNKTSSAVELRVKVDALGIPGYAAKRLQEQQRNRINQQRVLIIQAEEYRSQQRNRDAALDRLNAMLEAAHKRPKVRIATKPSKGQKKKRLDNKKRRGEVKAGRRKPDH